MSALSRPTSPSEPVAPPNPPLPRTSLLVMLLLTIVTLSFYLPVWYLRRLKAFNALRSTVKLTAALPVAALVLQVMRIGASFFRGILEALGATSLANLLGAGDTILGLAAVIVYLVLSFKVRDVLQDHLRARISDYGGASSVSLQSQVSLSGVWTFVFNEFYLQYKINEYHRELTSGAGTEG